METIRPLSAAPKPVRWYTVGLFIAAAVFLISAVVFRWLNTQQGQSYDIVHTLSLIYFPLGALLAAVGVVRTLNARWGYYATFGLSLVLLPLLPVGTIASLIWFKKVRQHEPGRAPVIEGSA